MDQAPILYIIGIARYWRFYWWVTRGLGPNGGFRDGEFLQVSELVKLIIIIVLARFFAEVRTDELSCKI